ncbi:hypothetical protein J6590_047660 [Homalodisca vitripennis]|nr:hypothetical protein J6590_047660 [Homalodisca vitripennis]
MRTCGRRASMVWQIAADYRNIVDHISAWRPYSDDNGDKMPDKEANYQVRT